MTLTPKNWKSFQHYTDRRPAWIKLHRGLLDDYEFARLPLASKALAPLLWLLASEYNDGIIPCTVEELAFRIRCSPHELIEALKPLIDGGFFIADSAMLAECGRVACLEKRTSKTEIQEEKEKKAPSLRSGDIEVSCETSDFPEGAFEKFYEAYPRKQQRKAAQKAFEKVRKSGEVKFAALLAGIAKIPRGEARFIPYPATWLNTGSWDDEPVSGGTNGHRPSAGARQSSGADFFAGLKEVAANLPGDGGVAGSTDPPIPVGRVNIEHH